MINRLFFCAGIAAFGWAAASAEEVRFSQLPAATQKTINRNLNGGIVQEIDRKTVHGRTLYDVEIQRDGKHKKLRVDANGRLLRFDLQNEDHAAAPWDTVKNGTFWDSDVRGTDSNTDEPKDRGMAGDHVAGNKSKILGIPVPVQDHAINPAAARMNMKLEGAMASGIGEIDTGGEDSRPLTVPIRGLGSLSLGDLPLIVRETIHREAGGFKVLEINWAKIDGDNVYKVNIERDAMTRELHIATNGIIVNDSDRVAIGAPATRESGTDQGK